MSIVTYFDGRVWLLIWEDGTPEGRTIATFTAEVTETQARAAARAIKES